MTVEAELGPEPPAEIVEIRLRVPPELAGLRLDRFIQNRIPRLSRNRIQTMLSEHRAASAPDEARRWRPSYRLRAGEEVVLRRRLPPEPDTPRHCGILYEDSDLLGVDKPAGLPVH